MYNTHAYTTYTQQFLHSHHASTGPHVSLFFCFYYFSVTLLETTTTSGSKTAEGRFLQKKQKEKLNKMGYHSKCNKKYSWSHAENSWQTSHTFWGHHISETLGKALAFPSHGSVTAFTAKAAFSSLDYKPHFSKHGVNRIPWRVWRAGQECTAHKLEWIQGKILAGNSGNRPGSNTQTWLFPFYTIRYTWLILSNSWTRVMVGGLWPNVVAFICYIHSFKCT